MDTGIEVNMPSTRNELIDARAAGERFSYFKFWGHRAPKSGGVGPGCLSQWWPCKFEVDGLRYDSAEQYMMAEKARLFDDMNALDDILASDSPRRAKAIGRRVRNFDEETWASHRFEIVCVGNSAKFGQNSRLAGFLRSTGNHVIVEASPNDTLWGIGLSASDIRSNSPSEWRGDNLLGFALMRVRGSLNQGSPDT